MTHPNQYTLAEKGVTYGLHKFKDGVLTIFKRHSSGDWINLGTIPTESQVKRFQTYGTKAVDALPDA